MDKYDLIMFELGEIKKNLSLIHELDSVPVPHHTFNKIQFSVEQIEKLMERIRITQ